MAEAPDAGSRALRQRRILDHVLAEGQASVAELAALTGRSVMTVHRDLEDLANRQLLRRFHGGVSALPTSVFESSSEFRIQRRTEAKRALAAAASDLIEPGMSISLDDSTTVLGMTAFLAERSPLTVVTNYRQVLERLSDTPDIRLIIIGGQYSRTHDSFIGPPDQTNADAYAVDIAFQSTSTMTADTTFHQEQEVVSMKRVMLRAGTRRVLLMDGSKVGLTSLHRYVPVDAFTDVFVTDDVDGDVARGIADRTHLRTVPVQAGFPT